MDMVMKGQKKYVKPTWEEIAFERRFWREDEQDELGELCGIPVDDLEAEN